MADPDYILPEPEKEVQRLTDQDEVLAHCMGNKRIAAPLQLTKPNLKILDSGTADGLFLRKITPLLTAPYSLEGYDIMSSFFPSSTPPSTKLAIHNIAEEWPTEMHGKYDFVHQRLTLLGAGKQVPLHNAVEFLGTTVRTGGWIQLGELDVQQPVSGGQALHDAWTLVRGVFNAICGDDSFAHQMGSWLEDSGFQDVSTVSYEISLGTKCKDPAIRQKSIDVTLGTWGALLGAARAYNANVEESVTDNLIERLGE